MTDNAINEYAVEIANDVIIKLRDNNYEAFRKGNKYGLGGVVHTQVLHSVKDILRKYYGIGSGTISITDADGNTKELGRVPTPGLTFEIDNSE